MNREIGLQWIQALESGDYTQGVYVLRQNDSRQHYRYCCLGVLCDLYQKAHPDTQWQDNNNTFLGHIVVLPSKVSKWVGISSEFQGSLMNANDHERDNFPQIAQRIREEMLNETQGQTTLATNPTTVQPMVDPE